MPDRVMGTLAGASWEVNELLPDDPMCMQITVPRSWQAAKKRSQWSVCSDGWPSGSGFSGNVTAWQPLSARRCTSTTARSTSK